MRPISRSSADKRQRLRLPEGWQDILLPACQSFNTSKCGLVVKHHCVYSNHNIFVDIGCKRNCTAKFNIHGRGRRFTFSKICDGVKHTNSIPRPLRSIRRKELAAIDCAPNELRAQMAATAGVSLTEIPSNNVLRTARFELRQTCKTSNDELDDLLERCERLMPRYFRSVQVIHQRIPEVIMFWMDEGMDLMKRVSVKKSYLCH